LLPVSRFPVLLLAGIEDEMRTDRATRAMREANAAFKTIERHEPITDYASEQRAIHDNRERLKAERLAREAKSGNRPGPKSGRRPG
jgi:hypothetical protein